MNRIQFYVSAVALLWSILGSHVQASPPDWSVNPASYSNSMVMVGALNFHRVESIDENDIIAAFINGECRGISKPQYEADVDRFLAYLLIYANETEAVVTFKLYSAEADQVFNVTKTAAFVVNGLQGDMERPYVWSSVLLNEEALLHRFSVPDQVSSSISGEEVRVSMRLGTELSDLIPTFETSQGATVWVDEVQQQSGINSHDFSQSITYMLRSEDEQTFVSYTVQVVTTDSRIGEPLKAVNAISPNGDGINDYWVVKNIELFEGFELSIYDSAGNLLYNTVNYQNTWDGRYKGRSLPEGVYYYLFIKEDTKYRGIITILQ